jgi:hypothetical protein
VEEKYKKVKLVCISSSQITSLCNETTMGVSCEREWMGEWGEGVEGGDIGGSEEEGRYVEEIKSNRWI